MKRTLKKTKEKKLKKAISEGTSGYSSQTGVAIGIA
jgi:hypothetical protein